MFEIFVSLSLSMKKAQSEIVKCKRLLILWEFEINFYNTLVLGSKKLVISIVNISCQHLDFKMKNYQLRCALAMLTFLGVY